MSREAILSDLCDRILALAPGRPAAVAVDGADAAGKSTFADALVAPLETRGAVVVRASVDDFERPRAERHARGRFSAKGYYRNSFDYDALKTLLLAPLASGTSPALVRTRAFDLVTDQPVPARPQAVPARGVVIVDGVFLLRPELRDAWDFSVLLQVDEAEAMRRALLRAGGDSEELRRLNEARYQAGYRLYVEDADPIRQATVVIDNNDPREPVMQPAGC
ncbi:MAG: uridine kinase [Alphaproteobacteria bacterium]|nr:uridine kinase [Rhodospirillaceae bacterium]MBT6512813.1 uridine kinase [Rhodospirillaceae bacterium]MBT7613452.1 uridine kinase [Rhodospirillaceae bacterium]MBT7645695.1 uridine kinase [Rhodospirillaceae bacterium]MDG2482125.1 uridine kinase [Alphaproteobacteria bacterium]